LSRSREEKDRRGVDHLYLNINAEGPRNKGVIRVHMTRPPGTQEYDYEYLALQVPGQDWIYLERASDKKNSKTSGRMFGIKWW
jgi:mitochondrial import inner membrane translocase subunit TIM21